MSSHGPEANDAEMPLHALVLLIKHEMLIDVQLTPLLRLHALLQATLRASPPPTSPAGRMLYLVDEDHAYY